jgi:phosphatidylinositol 3-kinase
MWEDEAERRQALDLLKSWVNIDVDEALELLGPFFEDNQVREYGVFQLERCDVEVTHHFDLQSVAYSLCRLWTCICFS